MEYLIVNGTKIPRKSVEAILEDTDYMQPRKRIQLADYSNYVYYDGPAGMVRRTLEISEPEPCPWVFHYTLKRNIPSILKDGLVPKVGLHSKLDKHKVEKVFVLTSLYTASMSACGMVDNHDLGEFGEESDPDSWNDENISILAIRKEGIEFHPDPGYEGADDNPVAYYTYQNIPPSAIAWATNFDHIETPECCGNKLEHKNVVGGKAIQEDDQENVFLYDWVGRNKTIIQSDYITQHYVCPVCGQEHKLDCITEF